jgi:hypothetical protein
VRLEEVVELPSVLLEDTHEFLRATWPKVVDEYTNLNPHRRLIITASYRTPEEQFALFRVGRTFAPDGVTVESVQPSKIVTTKDGYRRQSNHNFWPAQALDFAVLIAGKVTWTFKEYENVGVIAEKHGLIWGGRWTVLRDGPHVEVPIAKLGTIK